MVLPDLSVGQQAGLIDGAFIDPKPLTWSSYIEHKLLCLMHVRPKPHQWLCTVSSVAWCPFCATRVLAVKPLALAA